MRIPTNLSAVESYTIAMRLHTLGLMPKLIGENIPGTKALVRGFTSNEPHLSFSRGYSKVWVKSNKGFKLSNILFKIYGIVSGDPALKNGLCMEHIATAWEVAYIQYPELIDEKICDISRFTYLIQKVVSSEFLIFDCKSKNCKNKFIVHEDCSRFHCWSCCEKHASMHEHSSRHANIEVEHLRSIKIADTSPARRKDNIDPELHRKLTMNLFSVKSRFNSKAV